MRKLCSGSTKKRSSSYIRWRAPRAHYRLMSIYPWTKNSGKVGRLLLNLLLVRDGYPPAIVHSIERQRYYDALRAENGQIAQLLLESLNTYVGTANRFFDELAEVRRPGGKAAS